MLKKILIALALIIVVFLIIVSLQPATYAVTRSVKVAGTPAAAFAEVNDFHKWEAWSPWAKLDPAMKITYDGAAAGKGAHYTWVGNDKVGEGQMTILESHPDDSINIKLEFIKPFASVCATDFTFKPDGNQTVVTWTMSGQNTFISKAMCLFMNMDKMIGPDFEKGLAQLNTVVSAMPKP